MVRTADTRNSQGQDHQEQHRGVSLQRKDSESSENETFGNSGSSENGIPGSGKNTGTGAKNKEVSSGK